MIWVETRLGNADKPEKDLQQTFPFLATTETTDKVSSENPKGAGRKGQDFLSYLKAFLLAPVLRVEQNCEAIAAAIAANPAFYVACGFTASPAARTLRDFDQIVCDSGLWVVVDQPIYEKNVEDKVIVDINGFLSTISLTNKGCIWIMGLRRISGLTRSSRRFR